jgi:hypothetical protein
MSTYPEAPARSEDSAQIGPPPYYHRSDCHICRKQDGLKTGSELLDAPRPGGYIVEGEHFVAEHAPGAGVQRGSGHRRSEAASVGFR